MSVPGVDQAAPSRDESQQVLSRHPSPLHRKRRNLVAASAEAWRPPAFPAGTGPFSLRARARRVLDLQAASIWADVRPALSAVQGTFLDVGCGNQPYRGLIPAGTVYRGLDTIECEAVFGYGAPDTIRVGDPPWPLGDASIDTVLCTEVLEHVRKPAVLLAEMARVLRPGGALVLTVPFAARWHFVPNDYWRFTPSSLSDLIGGAGFHDIRIHARGNPATVAAQKVLALISPLLLPATHAPLRRWSQRLAAVPLVPIVVGCCAVAHLTMRRDWGEDCLGYTVFARR